MSQNYLTPPAGSQPRCIHVFSISARQQGRWSMATASRTAENGRPCSSGPSWFLWSAWFARVCCVIELDRKTLEGVEQCCGNPHDGCLAWGAAAVAAEIKPIEPVWVI